MAKIVRSSLGAKGAETRAQILEAAGHLFGRQGYQKATMTALAEEVGISKATIYQYFENKHDVYATLVREISQDIYEANRAAVTAVSGIEAQLRAFIVTRYRNIRAMLSSYDAKSPYLLEDRAVTAVLVSEWLDKEFALVESILRDAQAAGDVGDIDPGLSTVAITATLRALDTPWIFHLEPIDVEERADDLVQLFLRGLSPRKDDA